MSDAELPEQPATTEEPAEEGGDLLIIPGGIDADGLEGGLDDTASLETETETDTETETETGAEQEPEPAHV